MRGRRLALIRGAGVAACVFLGVMLAACLSDRFVQFPAAVRGLLLGAAGLTCLVLVVRPLLQLTKPEIDWLAVTEQIETQDDRFGQRLLTVTSRLLGEHNYRGSDEMLDKLSYELDREAAAERPSRLLPARRVVGPWLLFAVLLGIAYGLISLPDINLPRLGLRFLTPWQPIDPVTTTQLVVVPGDRDLAQGAPATIEASIRRLGGGLAWFHLAEVDDTDPSSLQDPPWQKFQMSIRDLPAADGVTTRPATQPGPPATQPGSPAGSDEPIHFTYTLTSIDRDVRYYITAGDAKSRVYTLRALRKPAIAEFRVRFIYPPHTGRPPATFTSADGRLEAPTGTEAELTVVSTEPLKSALLTYAGETQAMVRPNDDATGRFRQAKVLLSRDGRLDFGLVSTREQAGIGPVTAEVKVVPDRPPIVRVGVTGQTLRLGPRDLLPISYEALDDFGIDALTLRAQVGSAAPVEFPVVAAQPSGEPGDLPAGGASGAGRTSPDPRRREGLYDLDLARLPLAVGDVVTLVLAGRDTSNQFAVSEALHVLVSPRSVGIDTYELISELDAAALLAASVGDDLQEAAKRLAEADPGTSFTGGRLSRRFSAAGSAAALVRRALVRGIGREPSPELSAAMLAWIDEAQTLSSTAESCFRELGGEPRLSDSSTKPSPRSRPAPGELLALTRGLTELANRLAEQLRIGRDGLRSATVLADLENAAAIEKRGPPKSTGTAADKAAVDRYKQSRDRMRDEINAAGKALSLQPSAGDFKKKLQGLVDRGNEVSRGKSKVDYIAAAREWSQQVQRNTWQPIVLDERMSAAAQAEAVRPGGDLRIARDLNLAARAAAAIDAAGDRTRPVPVSPATANAYVSAFEALAREHAVLRRPTDLRMADEQATIAANASKARALMEQWSGQGAVAASPPTTAPVARTAALEAIALQAGAAAAERNYEAADSADAALSRQLASQSSTGDVTQQALEKARRATVAARTLDTARTSQLELAGKTAAANVADAPALADAQRQIASDLETSSRYRTPVIAGIAGSTFNARDKTAEAYLAAQNRLVAMPQQVASLLEADATYREAAERTRLAREELDRASPANKAAAARMAEMAQQEQAAAAARLAEQAQAIGPAIGQSMLVNLDSAAGRSADDPSQARDVIATQLTPALKSLVEAVGPKAGERSASDRARVDRAAAEARQAIDASQVVVARWQDELAMQDPLTSARWYARAAADALSRKPPDFRAAEKSQRSAVSLMSRARDDTLRYASGQRVLAVRSARPVMVAPADTPAATAADPAAPPTSAWSILSGEFRRLRPREMDEATGLLHRTDPPGYEASIKAYFEAIEKGRERKEK